MERLMSSVQNQPPQRERHGPINQTFSTPFEWKIPNIQYVLLRTMLGAECLVSEPFYLFSIGYKYLLKLQINGSRQDQGLDVKIKVVPGEFDELLSWPCKEKVRVTIVDQKPLLDKRVNMPEVIDFDKGKKPCSRPLCDDYHDYRHVIERAVSVLRCGSYMKNNTLLIMVNRE